MKYGNESIAEPLEMLFSPIVLGPTPPELLPYSVGAGVDAVEVGVGPVFVAGVVERAVTAAGLAAGAVVSARMTGAMAEALVAGAGRVSGVIAPRGLDDDEPEPFAPPPAAAPPPIGLAGVHHFGMGVEEPESTGVSISQSVVASFGTLTPGVGSDRTSAGAGDG